MKKFLKYELKKGLLPLLALTVIACALFITICMGGRGTSLGMIVFILCALATIIPIMQFSFKMNSKSVDVFYALPISRRKIYLVKTVVGLLQMIVAFTLAYWIGFFIVAGRSEGYNLLWYIPYYFVCIGLSIVLFGTNAFIFTRANSMFDGIVFIAFASCAVVLAFGYFESVVLFNIEAWKWNSIDLSFGFTYSPLVYSCTIFDNLIRYGRVASPPALDWLVFVFFSLAGAAAYFGLFYTVKKEKAENAGQISNSAWGYKTFIPYYLAGIIGLIAASIGSLSWIICIVLVCTSYVGMAIYRRSFKIKFADIILILVGLTLGFCLNILLENF